MRSLPLLLLFLLSAATLMARKGEVSSRSGQGINKSTTTTFAGIAGATNTSCGLANGSMTIIITQGTPPFTYAWSHDSEFRDSVARDLAAGVYQVTVTAANEAMIMFEREINPSPAIAATAAPLVQPTTCGRANGNIQMNLGGGTGELSYAWSHAPGLNSPNAAGLDPGSYPVIVTDEAGCTYTDTSTVASTPQPSLQLESQGQAACTGVFGSAAFLLLNFSEETGLGLEGPGITISREVLGPDSVRLVVKGLSAGDYLPMVTDSNGCTAEVALRIEEDTPLLLGLVDQDDVTCIGGNNGRVGVEATGGAPPYTYDWNGDGVDDGASQENLPAGPYSVLVTDARSCTALYSGVINEPEGLEASVVMTPSLCAGSSSGIIQLSVTGGVSPYNYNWLGLSGETGTEADSLATGEYSIVVTDANGCALMVTQAVSEQGNNTVLSVADSASVSCRGLADGSVTVAASGDPAGFTYAWSNNQAGPTATGLVGGQNYVVVVTNANGCSSELQVELGQGPLMTLSDLPSDTFICEGNEYLLDLSAYPVRQVNGPNGFSSGDTLLSLTEAGIYQISAAALSGCTAVDSLSLTVTDSSFSAEIAMSTDAVIALPFPAFEQSVPKPDSVAWRYAETVLLSDQQDRTYFFNFSEPGDYTLGLVSYLQGCIDSTFATVTMHADSSTITSVAIARAAAINLRVGPNPNTGAFTLTADLPVVSRATALLYGPAGQLVMKRALPRAATISERFELALPAGVYYLYLIAEEGRWVVPVVVR